VTLNSVIAVGLFYEFLTPGFRFVFAASVRLLSVAWPHQCSILKIVDTASSKPANLVLPLPAEQRSTATLDATLPILGLPLSLIQELWRAAEAETCSLSLDEFSIALSAIGERVNYGLPPGVLPDAAKKAGFFRSLHLAELALAHACALGREAAWETFLSRYRSPVVHAAVSITGSATLGHDLADSLYAELYGLRQAGGERRSPLASYTGRGSLLAWLRTTLVQRWRDHHRRTHRETPLDNFDSPAPAPTPIPADLAQLTAAVARTLRGLAAEDRFLLSAYFLDRQTLLQIAQTLAVHEATISRRLKRLADNLRKQLIDQLISSGFSKAAAEEALGDDPRDIEINLRMLLQTSQVTAFSNKTAPTAAGDTL
jgi:RNA polymerase sigma-70 factor (ECF subfamily)